MNNKGPFDPATYGGDAKKALLVRQAFLHGVPRQEIVDKLIKPINPDAEVRNSFLKTAGTPGYDEIVAQNGSADYAEADPAMSKDLLKQAGVKTPVNVRLMYAKDNVRRVNEFQLDEAGAGEGRVQPDRRRLHRVERQAGRRHLRRRVLRLAVDEHRRSAPTRRSTARPAVNNLIGYCNKQVDSTVRRSWS